MLYLLFSFMDYLGRGLLDESDLVSIRISSFIQSY